MPMPSVEPIPLPSRLLRFDVPDDAQEASYLAASARIASFSRVSSCAICSIYVRIDGGASGTPPVIGRTARLIQIDDIEGDG